MTVGHGHGLAMHVRAAPTNGLIRAGITKAITHTTVYAGAPAENSAIGIVRDMLVALDAS